MVRFEQAFEIAQAIIDTAEIIRNRFALLECDECGARYHPRQGPPPEEPTENCGHADFREAYSYWDPETERYQ